jgi:hypothetical protein
MPGTAGKLEGSTPRRISWQGGPWPRRGHHKYAVSRIAQGGVPDIRVHSTVMLTGRIQFFSMQPQGTPQETLAARSQPWGVSHPLRVWTVPPLP